MLVGKVEGSVVCTVKNPRLEGLKLLLVRIYDNGKLSGDILVAADATRQAGEGDLVSLIGSKEASLIIGEPYSPCDLAITGFIDSYNM